MTGTHDMYREWDAAYVLGALSPEDRRAFERHLSVCPRCEAAVAELAGMPGILGLLSASDARAVGSDGDPLLDGAHQTTTVQRLATAVRAERRKRRRLVAVGAVIAAGILMTAGIVLGGTVFAPRVDEAIPAPSSTPSSSVRADVLEMTPFASGTLTAELTVTPKRWGTLLAWECRYGGTSWTDPAGGPVESPQYALVVTRSDGTETAVATWRAAGKRAGELAAATSIPADDIRSVDIRTVSGNQPLARATLRG
ncbi:MAG: zf-HC2 domain-containing protein [Mycetocola sp.]